MDGRSRAKEEHFDYAMAPSRFLETVKTECDEGEMIRIAKVNGHGGRRASPNHAVMCRAGGPSSQ